MIRALLFAILLALLPAVSHACAPLTAHFDLCGEDSGWIANAPGRSEPARWRNGEMAMMVTENFAAYDAMEESFSQLPMDKQLAGVLGLWFQVSDFDRLGEDAFTTRDLTVAGSLDDFLPKAGPTERRLTLVARADQTRRGRDRRVMVVINTPPDMDPDQIRAMARDIAAMIRPKRGN